MTEAQDFHKEILERLDKIDKRLDPIWETYNAWTTLGRWGKALLYIAGAVLGLIIAWKQIFSK